MGMNKQRFNKILKKRVISLVALLLMVVFIGNNIPFSQVYAASLDVFPDSYRPGLQALVKLHPNWKFVPVEIGPSWDEVVQAETKLGLNLVHKSFDDSWKSTEEGAYLWESNTYIYADSNEWVNASRNAVEYYLDPRNFFTEKSIFQFLDLAFDPDTQNIDGVKRILKGSFMDGVTILRPDMSRITYAEAFMEAARESGASPYHLATRVVQEVGFKGSGSSSGKTSGYEGIFNFYNVGANTSSNATLRGLAYAKAVDAATGRPWNSPYKSIIHGAIFIADEYVKREQETLYLQKFDIKNGEYWHQYMTNVQAAASEGQMMAEIYSDAGLTDSSFTFLIPVFKDMEYTPHLRPNEAGNPNNWLASLSVEGYALNPTFEPSGVGVYSIIVPEKLEAVRVDAIPVAPKARVSPLGLIPLKAGNNTIRVIVSAENGDERVYEILILREGSVEEGVFDSFPSLPETENVDIPAVQMPDILLGDIDGDGLVTSVDLAMACNHVLKESLLDDSIISIADMNGDGKVTSTDLTLISRQINKSTPEL